MRLTTWNVNGIRNPFSYPPWNTARTFSAMFDILGSDVVVMQELKIQRKDLRDDMVLLDGWDCYFSLPKHKKGYSGVGIYTRSSTCAPIRAEEGLLGVLPSPWGVPYCDLPANESIGGYPTASQVIDLGVDPALLDAEGRCLVLEFPAFVLLGVYSPANSNGMRDDFRYGFICALDCRIRNLVSGGKRVVLVGDLNVSRDEIDTASAVEDMRKAGISHDDYISTPNRRIFNQLLVGGEVTGDRDEGRQKGVLWDTTRGFHPKRRGMYTHWEQKINARPGNYGSRIDFILVSESMRDWVQDANIQEGLLGSDHCPVFIDFKDDVSVDGQAIKLKDIMNAPGAFNKGVRMVDWKITDVPAFSAKRLPEFDKRRSIKSMFAAPNLKKAQSSSASQHGDGIPVPIASGLAPKIQPGNRAEIGSKSSLTPLKRKTSSPMKPRYPKQQKGEVGQARPKGQQSLKGFFQKNAPASMPDESLPGAEHIHDQSRSVTVDADSARIPMSNNPTSGKGDCDDEQGEDDTTQIAASPIASPNCSPSRISAKFEEAEQNQKSWNALFSRPMPPLCEGHNEPCITMQTKKKGSNQGRSFWMCARPLGPSGNKERGTEWRCPAFIWCSEWQGKKGNEQSVNAS